MLTHFHVLKNRNYSLYFFGQFLSMTGTFLQSVVLSWVVYRLTGSGAWLGAISFFSQIPAFIVSPIAGVMADQKDRRKILLNVQIFSMLQAFLLAGLVFSGKIVLWQIAVLSVGLGILNAFDMTTRHAFTYDLVGKPDLPSAIALNSILINGSKIFGPALAGIMLTALGEGWCFALNGLSYLAVIYGLVKMKTQHLPHKKFSGNPFNHIREAAIYTWRFREIRALLAVATFISLVGFQYQVLMPIVAKDLLHGDASTLAWLTASNGIGAVIGGFTGTSRFARIQSDEADPKKTHHRTFDELLLRTAGIGVSMIALGLALGHSAPPLLVGFILAAAGYFIMSSLPIINTSIQSLVDNTMRGRVLSLYMMTYLGATPIGYLVAGWLSDRVGTVRVIELGGFGCIAFGIGWIMLRSGERLRPFVALGARNNKTP